MNTKELSPICRQVRRDIITMTANAGSGHPGGSLSAVELMTSVFFNHMRVDPQNPHDPNRDRFVLSKGHAAPCYYAVLAAKGFISRDEYANFRQLHSILQGHPDAKKVPGVDASTGSLGQGLACAVGMAMACPSLSVWRSVPSISARIRRSSPSSATVRARRVRSGRLIWPLRTINSTI